MNCDGVRDLLSAYLDGELSPGELLRVEQHLRRCHACADEVDSLRQTMSLVASLEEVEVPAAFHAQLHQRLVALGPPTAAASRTRTATSLRQHHVRRWSVPASAAAAVAALAIGFSVYSSGGSSIGQGILAPAGNMAEKPVINQSQMPGPTVPGPGTSEVIPPAPPAGENTDSDTSKQPTPENTTGPAPSVAPGKTHTEDGPRTATTLEQVVPPEKTAPIQIATSYTVAVAWDQTKIDTFKGLHTVKEDQANGVMVTLPLGSEQASLDEIKSLWPDADIQKIETNVGPEIEAAQERVDQLQAELDQIMRDPKSEQQALQVTRLKNDKADAEFARDALIRKTGHVTITLQAR